MTRNEQTLDQATYDGDFFIWTQQQAAALRLTRDVIGDSVDVEHVAEELEDMGKRDVREVSSFLERLIEHLLKLDAAPLSRDGAHWWSEANHFQNSARATFTPGMRQLIDVEQVWSKGCRATGRFFRDLEAAPSLPSCCPFTASELLAADFDIDAALAKLAAARDTPRP